MNDEFHNQTDLANCLESHVAVMLYFYNNDCAPCISLRPKVEKLVEITFPRMKVIWVNSKAQPEIPAHYGVFANPTILLFFDGKETRRFSKYVSVDELAQSIERYYKIIF
ncbi:MAG: thioredoxin family protein [Bacteroidales bacterium]